MVVDAFCHIYPVQYIDELKKRCNNLLFDKNSETGYVRLRSKGDGFWVGGSFKEDSHFTNPQDRFIHMAKYGVDVQVLSMAPPGTQPYALATDQDNVVAIAKVANDSISRIVERYPDKFVGVAEVPVLSQAEAIDEVERAANDLGLKALQLYTQTGGISLDSPLYDPIYERASKYRMPILVHPAILPQGVYRKYETDFSLYAIYGMPYETSLALSRAVFSGVLDRFPNLVFISHHLGGMIPYFAGRIIATEGQERQVSRKSGFELKRPTIEYFKLMYHDTAVSGHAPALECGYSFFGPDHIVFSTDYPFGHEHGEYQLRENLNAVKGLRVPEEDKQKILDLNARKLFNIA